MLCEATSEQYCQTSRQPDKIAPHRVLSDKPYKFKDGIWTIHYNTQSIDWRLTSVKLESSSWRCHAKLFIKKTSETILDSAECNLRLWYSSHTSPQPRLSLPWWLTRPFPLCKIWADKNLIKHNVMFRFCIFFQGPKITYNYRLPRRRRILLRCFTLSFVHIKLNNT